ncbi:MAG: hypothetical protein ABFR97_10495 [Thermodesulfobacteriota bacterium]
MAEEQTTWAADTDVGIDEEMAVVGTGIILAGATIIGLWGAACMASALIQFGITGVIQGWFSAISG